MAGNNIIQQDISDKDAARQPFDAYVERMFSQWSTTGGYDINQAVPYLTFLAARMQEHNQLIYSIKKMQPNWLGHQERLFRIISGLLFGLIVGLPLILLFGLLYGFSIGLPFALLGGLIGGLAENRLAKIANWSWKDGLWYGLRRGLLFGLLGGLIGGLIYELFFGLLYGLVFVLIGVMIGVMLFGLIYGPLFGFLIGLFSGLIVRGESFVKHYLLRWFLARNNYLPFKLIPFLDEMVERNILQKVDGGYIFIHRMLLDYFASLETGV